jgi:hypothetical protein
LKYYKGLAKTNVQKSFVVYAGKEKADTKDGTMLPWNEMEELYKL